jgi:hypothetical protein
MENEMEQIKQTDTWNHLGEVKNISREKLVKMMFLSNAIENGWEIRKKNNSYIFRKKHDNKKEIFDNEYLTTFIKENMVN